MLSRWLEKPDKTEDSDSRVFGDYDIRGKYPSQVNENLFRRLAAVFVQKYNPKEVIIGRDSRRSSLSLAKALAEEFSLQGVSVIDVGFATAPYGAWLAKNKRREAFVITASHNPPEENGLKLYARGGEAIAGSDLTELATDIKNSTKNRRKQKKGFVSHKDFRREYQNYLLKISGNLGFKPRVAVDYMNGTVGVFLEGILDRRKVRFTTLRQEPTGDFPPYGPNPLLIDSHKNISHLIKEGRYACGAIFDGDGDRVIFFDEAGDLIKTALIAALLCEHMVFSKGQSRSIIVPVNFSRIIDDVARNKGTKVYRSPVGRTNLIPVMRAKGAAIGVERSGHYFFRNFFYHDNAILTFLTVLKILEKNNNTPFSKLITPYEKYATLPEENIPYVPSTEIKVLKTVRAALPGWKVNHIDGLTVEYKDWWFNLRRSHTQNLWRLSVEATNEPLARQKLEAIEEIVKNVSSVSEEEE